MSRESAIADRILVYLKEHKRLTSMEAVRLFNTTRASARIFELRERGYKIATIMNYEIDPITRDAYKYGTYVYQGKVSEDVLPAEENK